MVKIAITFDDGRSDNLLVAKPIMDKYDLVGTVFITTGYVDGTWKESDMLFSPTRPLTVDEIKTLDMGGWEIGLHGDKHLSTPNDYAVAVEKMNSWLNDKRNYGMSLPNSRASQDEIRKLWEAHGDTLKYIRGGRAANTRNAYYIFLYALYTKFKVKQAYFGFNRKSVVDNSDREKIFSIVVRNQDDWEMIVDFVKSCPSGANCVFMFHTIMNGAVTNEAKPWVWSEKKFDYFCEEISELRKENKVEIVTLDNIIKNSI